MDLSREVYKALEEVVGSGRSVLCIMPICVRYKVFWASGVRHPQQGGR